MTTSRKTKKHSPLPSENLNDNEAWPFSDGANEIVVRVSSYKDDGVTPASFQAIVRGRNRMKAWGVGVRANPVPALTRAIESFFEPKVSSESNADIAQQELDIRLGRAPKSEPLETPSVDDLLS